MTQPAAPVTPDRRRARWAVVFGWLAGGAAGVLVNTGLELLLGARWPETIGIFGLFVGGAFGGMFVAERLGARAFRVMGIAAGLLLAITVLVLAVTFLQ